MDGRQFAANEMYLFPIANEGVGGGFHECIKLLLGDGTCYIGPVEDVLRDGPSSGKKAILDLGYVSHRA